MAINLQEIRAAVINYVDSKVTVSISEISPSGGSVINPNAEFSFTLTVRNADAASGGIPLKDIIWRVWVENEEVVKLIVPLLPWWVVRSGLSNNSTLLAHGDYVREMFIFPSTFGHPPHFDPRNYLGVGETDSITLKGKAGSAAEGGTTNLGLKIYADVDMDWLFPKDQDSSTVTRVLNVVG